MSNYTKIRRVYAWIGFTVFWSVVACLLYLYVSSCVIRPTKIEAATIATTTEVAAIVTEYTSSPNETDATPFVNAEGTRPHEGSVACPNQYSFGTSVVFDGKTYVCDDRMAAKFRDGSYFDIWVEGKSEAFMFGKQIAIITINL